MKQALVIMCSCCGVGLTTAHPDIRHLLLAKRQRGLPHPLRLYAYLKCDKQGRSTGISGVLRVDRNEMRVVAEFSWWPLGLILSFSDLPIHDALDVTDWLDCDYDERKRGLLMLPCRWNVTAYPLDFRTPQQVAREAEESLKGIRGRQILQSE